MPALYFPKVGELHLNVCVDVYCHHQGDTVTSVCETRMGVWGGSGKIGEIRGYKTFITVDVFWSPGKVHYHKS